MLRRTFAWPVALVALSWAASPALAAADAAGTLATLSRYEAKHRDEALGTASAWIHRHDANANGLIERSEQGRDNEELRIEVDEVPPGEEGTRTIRVYRIHTSLSGFELIDANQDGALSRGELAARILLDADDNNDGQLGGWDYMLRGFPQLQGRHITESKRLLATRSDRIEPTPSPSPLRPPAIRPTPPR